MDLNKLVEKRRSIYNLGSKEVLPQEKIIEIIKHSNLHSPTAFNSQSARTIVLFGKHHHKLWDITLDALKPLTPANKFEGTKAKIASFKAGFGTILFYEDENVVKGLQEKFPLYKDNFPKWSLQSNGMLEYLIWTTLAENNVGASLQHYNPLIDAQCAKEWNVPANWKLLAQMPFGNIESPADKKDFLPIDERVKIYK